MKTIHISGILILVLFFSVYSCKKSEPKHDVEKGKLLSSFNEGTAKENIINFVQSVTDPNSKNYIKPEDRIAVFDNDGTLWAEQPLPSQVYFSFDQIKKFVEEQPKFKNESPFKNVLDNDLNGLVKDHAKGLFKVIGMADSLNYANYNQVVDNWINTVKHPKLGIPYKNTVYVPMLEVLDYLRKNEFKIYIVSGGGTKFMRAWQPSIYGIPEENIIGSTFETKAVQKGDSIAVVPTTTFEFLDDHIGKVININKMIGKKPVMIFGNSDGDLEMMEYATTDNEKPTLMVFVNHTDGEREFKYDDKTISGKLIKGKEVAQKKGWTIIDMKNDWKTIFPKD